MRAWIAAVGLAGIGAVCLGAEPQAADLNLKSGQAVAFLGDSITQQGARPGGYVSLVGAGLKAAGYEVTIIGAGISGRRASWRGARTTPMRSRHRAGPLPNAWERPRWKSPTVTTSTWSTTSLPS